MGLSLRLRNLDADFKSLSIEPIIVNNVPSATEEDRALLMRHTQTTFKDQDTFSNVPRCDVGCTSGNWVRKGYKCPTCGTEVRDVFDEPLVSHVWLAVPKGVRKLVNPLVWTILDKRFRKSDFSLLQWLCNTDYTTTAVPPHRAIESLTEQGVKRGFNNFVDNFDAYFHILMRLPGYIKKTDVELWNLYRSSRDRFFVDRIPLPNKSLNILEENATGRYMDYALTDLLDGIKMLQGIDTEISTLSQRQRENRAVKAIVAVAKYCHDGVFKGLMGKKGGVIRKNVVATRQAFSTRAVISSITVPHRYDQVELAWGHGMTMLSEHLRAKLTNTRGFTPQQASQFVLAHTNTYHPLLDEIFQELIREDNGSLKAVIVRNPSLSRSSMQVVGISRVKTDPRDPTLGIPILLTPGFNADFDGDQMSLMLLGDSTMVELHRGLEPHNNAFDPNSPGKLSGLIAIPKPVAATMCSWFSNDGFNPVGQEQIDFLTSLR